MPLPHTGSGEGQGLDIGAELAEMALDGFPRSARGDAHLLVVIALAAAGGESIAKPMALLGRDSVGDVGKGRGALVGGDDQIGVIAIVPHRVVGRHDGVTIEIVGEFEQRANEDEVGFGAFRHPGIAIGGRRQAFGHEAAFGADRHDDRVLDLLGLDQAEDLGAEILRPVGPAQAAARHLAEAQMNAFDTGRIDENLVKRPRRRQVLDLARFKFERDHRTRVPVLADLPQIGADGGLHQIDEKAQDAVFVERGDGLSCSSISARIAVSRAERSAPVATRFGSKRARNRATMLVVVAVFLRKVSHI